MARPRITEERRRQILEAAAAVIAERGICDARISDIATRIGTSPALILYYFSGKDVLLAEALAYRDQQFFDGVASEVTGEHGPGRRLELLIEASCPPDEPLDRDSEWLLWLDVWTRSRHDETLARTRANMDRLFRVAIEEIVAEGIAAGEFAPIAVADFAIQLSALIDGLAIQVLLADPAVDSANMRRLSLDFARHALGLTTTV
jgi:AcrR family transcriptional regulator